MTATRLSVLALFVAAYWDLHRAVKALWPVAIMAFCLFIAAQFSAVLCVRLLKGPYIQVMLLKELIELASLVLIAPFVIALHRFIQLGETTHAYEFTTSGARMARFVGWLLFVGALVAIPSLKIITAKTGPVYYTGNHFVPADTITDRIMFVLVAAVFLMVMRLMIVLPAAAVDAPGTGLSNALADSSGHVGRIAAAGFLCLAPLACLFVMIAFPLRSLAGPGWVGLLIYSTLKICTFAGIALAAALASRIYLGVGDRLKSA
jgi:hypothetical protein